VNGANRCIQKNGKFLQYPGSTVVGVVGPAMVDDLVVVLRCM
jgi:hypothetical protein